MGLGKLDSGPTVSCESLNYFWLNHCYSEHRFGRFLNLANYLDQMKGIQLHSAGQAAGSRKVQPQDLDVSIIPIKLIF
jgi:hypothetical protein